MLAMQKMKSKRGRKLKSKLVNVTCQTEAAATYLQYNQIFCDCKKTSKVSNRKQIWKVIEEYFAEERNEKKKYSSMRYINRKQRYAAVSKTNTKIKSDNSVIYIGTKKLKSKKSERNLSQRSLIYIGTTYNKVDKRQNNDLVDLTKASGPAMIINRKENSAATSIEKPYLYFKCFPKTTTKYYKRPMFNSISDSVLLVKIKEPKDLKRKSTKSEHLPRLHKKFRAESIPINRNMCIKELLNVKIPQLSAMNKGDCIISRNLQEADISDNSLNKNMSINNVVQLPELPSQGNAANKAIASTNEIIRPMSASVAYDAVEIIASNQRVENDVCCATDYNDNFLQIIKSSISIQESVEDIRTILEQNNFPKDSNYFQNHVEEDLSTQH